MSLESPKSPPPVPGRKSGLAIASLTLGLIGMVFVILGPLFGVAAIICGYKARGEIRRSGGRLGGQRMATWGIITGYIATILIFVIVYAAMVFAPRIIAEQSHNNQRRCMENLQLIQGYKEKWALDANRPGTAVPRDADLFGPEKYLGKKPGCPAHGVYYLNSVQEPPFCSIHGTIRW